MSNTEPLTCGACGSDWFRLATFRKSSLTLFLPVCLCGTIAPEPARKVLPFGTVMGSSLGQAMAAVESLPDAAAGAILAHRIGRLEHSCLLIQRRLFPRLRIRPKPRLPVRRAATLGLDAIALDLQRTGLLNFRQARKVVRGVIDAWKAALATGESVRTPAGVLLVRTLRSGRRRIALRPAAQLRLAIETERTRQIASMPSIQNAESPLQCSRCGSQWFAEQEYCQYANQSYQSARRGPMVAMSDPQVARVCPCGMPFRPKRALHGRLLASADQNFLESWERVQKYLWLQSDAEERIGKRLREVVNAESVQQLLARVESAEQEVVRLTAELQARHLKPRRKAPRRP